MKKTTLLFCIGIVLCACEINTPNISSSREMTIPELAISLLEKNITDIDSYLETYGYKIDYVESDECYYLRVKDSTIIGYMHEGNQIFGVLGWQPCYSMNTLVDTYKQWAVLLRKHDIWTNWYGYYINQNRDKDDFYFISEFDARMENIRDIEYYGESAEGSNWVYDLVGDIKFGVQFELYKEE